MAEPNAPAPGVDSFWLDADQNDCADHPLERELGHRLDALERYRKMIDDAQASGDDDALNALIAQHDRQAKLAEELRAALLRVKQHQPS